MSNMGYCRYENSYSDLGDCADHLEDMDLSDSEKKYRKRLIEMCEQIVRDAENIGLMKEGEVLLDVNGASEDDDE